MDRSQVDKFCVQFSLILFKLFVEPRLQLFNVVRIEVAASVHLDPDRMDEVHVDVTGGQDVVGHFDDFLRIRFHSVHVPIFQACFHAFEFAQIISQN